MTWDVPTWNNDGADRLVMAIEFDEDTEMEEWCWRVGAGGVVVAEGREATRIQAVLEAGLAGESHARQLDRVAPGV